MKNRTGAGIAAITSVALASFIAIAVIFSTSAARAASDSEVIRGFNLTVFGAEYAPLGIQSLYVRKFSGPVRFRIHNLSTKNRTASVARFVASLNQMIGGLTAQVVTGTGSNFDVYVVDRADYVRIARSKVYHRPTAPVPGKCMVRSVFSRNGLVRSDAVIVSDGGEALFKRCLAEEILQGLGPLNEDQSLRESMFNDKTSHTNVTRFDKLILNMLYDRRIRNGQTAAAVQPVLPQVLKDAKRRVR
ncbi:MAG: DUF2927 domain-containing protein [Nitratireductor sp.]|nr:DUF2927 domain-containing protein [Nitratireductor sp.]MCC0020719.1 DUF2927 domain-containing protein [Nitratireductor sp.]